MVKKGHRKMQKGTPLITGGDVVFLRFATSPLHYYIVVFLKFDSNNLLYPSHSPAFLSLNISFNVCILFLLPSAVLVRQP